MPRPEVRLVWSPEAEADLMDIWRWGAKQFSPARADMHLRDIDGAANRLKEFPLSGVGDSPFPGIRSVAVNPTVIFYRIAQGAIEIVRVVEGDAIWRRCFTRRGKLDPAAPGPRPCSRALSPCLPFPRTPPRRRSSASRASAPACQPRQSGPPPLGRGRRRSRRRLSARDLS